MSRCGNTKKEANRFTCKSRPTEVEYTTVRRMSLEHCATRGGGKTGGVLWMGTPRPSLLYTLPSF